MTRNLTVESLDGALIEDLFPYTDYEARIVPFNSKGEGNASEVITVKTKEAGEVLSLIITITKLSNLIGYQLP